jgi:hypothetical protein
MAKKLGMSVIAAAMLATGGFAADNMTDAFKNAKYSGQFTVFYQSMENVKGNADADLLSQAASSAHVGMQLGLSTEELDGWTFNAKMYGVDTLGLENHVVSGIMVSPDAAEDNDNDGALNQLYWGEMNFIRKAGGTTFVVGRQKINTPLCNSDGWNVHPNTFDAIVAVNSDIPNLTLVGAYVGNERATVAGASSPYSVLYNDTNGLLGGSKTNGKMNTFFEEGAYAAAAIFTGIENTPIRFFYYDVTYIAQAMYADVATKVGGVGLAGQYMSFTPARYVKAVNEDSTTAFGAKVTADVAGFGLMGAYTSVGEDGILAAANVGDAQTKTPLYTATIGGDADIAGQVGTSAMKVSVSHDLGVKGLKAFVNYATYDHDADVHEDDSTSMELIAKYKAGHMSLFGALASYDHVAGYFAGDDGADNFLRVWARWTY